MNKIPRAKTNPPTTDVRRVDFVRQNQITPGERANETPKEAAIRHPEDLCEKQNIK